MSDSDQWGGSLPPSKRAIWKLIASTPSVNSDRVAELEANSVRLKSIAEQATADAMASEKRLQQELQLSKTASERALAVLTDEQREIFEALLSCGQFIDFDEIIDRVSFWDDSISDGAVAKACYRLRERLKNTGDTWDLRVSTVHHRVDWISRVDKPGPS